MPVRNTSATVCDAVASILAQDHADLELIVVDDGSTDDTADRVAAMQDDRIHLVGLGCHAGLVAALNRGLACARGPLLARLDGDDLCDPGRVGAQVEFLTEHPEVAVCDTQVEIFRDDGPIGGGFAAYEAWVNTIETHEDFERECLVENPVIHPAVMARTDLLREVGGYRDGPFPEDYDLWLRCLRAGARFHKLPRRLVRWRDGEGRATRTDPRYRRSAFFPLKWEHLAATRLRARPRVAVWGAGSAGRPWLRAIREHGLDLVAAFDIDPAKIGRTRQGAPVLSVEQVEEVDIDLLLVAVGARGARALIRNHLSRTRYREVEHFLFVA